ncbi:N-acetylmuramoyl-L-alanine amidase [Saccharothrix lopnurensis]|uniref:N-acetylmuramoyl-L-alanine amidase n=1 Tax=Saccharothrix lopnurensis TaxID=1670621 RepID=A0ABW1PHS3_9PSEU
MALLLAGLADALRAAGLTVIEHPGWTDRGQKDGAFAPVAAMLHHDASPHGDSPGVPAFMANLRNNGAQTWVDRGGRWHLVAAGRMWHAGLGGPWGPISRDDGNTDSVGVETDHTVGEDWPTAQLYGLRRGLAVLLRHIGAPASALCGHREYRTTNPDPDGLDMAHERAEVARIMKEGPDTMPNHMEHIGIRNYLGHDVAAQEVLNATEQAATEAEKAASEALAILRDLKGTRNFKGQDVDVEAVWAETEGRVARLETAVGELAELPAAVGKLATLLGEVARKVGAA